MKVIATDESLNKNIQIAELKRIANPGEVFEVTDERFIVLNGKNAYGIKFVEEYKEEKEVKEVKKKSKK